jgi:hypothetical protein
MRNVLAILIVLFAFPAFADSYGGDDGGVCGNSPTIYGPPQQQWQQPPQQWQQPSYQQPRQQNRLLFPQYANIPPYNDMFVPPGPINPNGLVFHGNGQPWTDMEVSSLQQGVYQAGLRSRIWAGASGQIDNTIMDGGDYRNRCWDNSYYWALLNGQN